ncbi:MAG: alanine racemase [Desulfohalobiaceae bacterium]|nr:alanine racemase [Desulfohalobiaceae bacterium]
MSPGNEHHYPVWAEIDLKAIGHNCREVKRIIPEKTRFMAVVKADGCGHGALMAAGTALNNGADRLGVARAAEGVALRQAGFQVPILVLGYTSPAETRLLLDHDLTQTVFDPEQAGEFSQNAQALGRILKGHLKVDTGMGRLGLPAVPEAGEDVLFKPEALEQALNTARLSGIHLEGCYTHFAQADSADKTHARGQLKCFQAFTRALEEKGLTFEFCHAANSAGVIDLPESHLDMVRPGIMLYGLYPSREVDHQAVSLKPAMSLKTRVAQIKEVGPGFHVSYGSTFVTGKRTKIATLPVGYADGYRRNLSSRSAMLVRGVRAPVVGRICMDQTMLDVGHIPEVEIDDEVVILGAQEGELIPAEELADLLGTINYEIVSTIMARVPRIYTDPA